MAKTLEIIVKNILGISVKESLGMKAQDVVLKIFNKGTLFL